MKNKELNHEFEYQGFIVNGFVMLPACLIVIPALIAAIFLLVPDPESALAIVPAVVLGVVLIVMLTGFFIQQPNESRVMIFFGKYRGTFRLTGYWWTNPFMTTKKMSLRIRNMDVAPIKVNDKVGNPVMIGMVLVWKINDTYRAVFDIDTPPDDVVEVGKELKVVNHKRSAIDSFVRIQSDAALREVASHFSYDNEGNATDEITLRSGAGEIVALLEDKLNERLAMAGIEVVEARLNYLAYAPEIAAVMLRRQQASAIISAREKIVEGAVSMVKMALDELKNEGVVELDEERKAAMVSNLLVVLCADDPAQPVVNTGTLYN